MPRSTGTPGTHTTRRSTGLLLSLFLFLGALTGGVAFTPPASAAAALNFRVLASNLCLDLAGRGAIQNTCNATKTQEWVFAPSNVSGYYKLEDAEGVCLAIDANSKAQGARAVRTSCANTPNREWHPLTISKTSERTIFEMVNVNSGLCLTDDNASKAAGHEINQSTCTHVSAQRWYPAVS